MRKHAVAMVFLLFFSLCAFSFTVKTEISNANEEIHWDLSQKATGLVNVTSPATKAASLEGVAFDMDGSALKEWHGKYSFVPHLYWPKIIEDGVNPGKPKASFKVFKDSLQLDCSPSLAVTELRAAGEEQRCDVQKETPKRAGIIKYRIDDVRGPAFELSRKIAWWVFKLADFYSIQGTDTSVEIDFSVAFRTDEEKGSGGTFTEFVSTQEELNALGLSSSGQSTGASSNYSDCAPVVKLISYGEEVFEDPKEFHYNNFGDLFSVVFTTGECDVEDFRIGFWDSQGLRGNPKLEIELLSSEIDQIDSLTVLEKQISLSESDYPEELFFGARLENSEGKSFFTDSVEFYFPAVQGNDEPKPVEPEPVENIPDLAGCNPCTSIPGCLACLDYLLADSS